VDTFIKTDYPSAVQVGLDTGSTPHTLHTLMPVFKKILERKPLLVTGPCTREELDEMLEGLSPEGLCLLVRVKDSA
jgi:hypothetical protein